MGCLAGAEPNGPVVVNIPTLGMSLSHGNPLRRPIPHGEYVSRWPSPECRLVGSDPHKHVRMSTMASNRDRSLPAGTGPSGPSRRTCSRDPVSHCQGPVASSLPQHCSEGTGLSHQGPVPESENSQDLAKIQEFDLLGRNTVYDLPPSVEELGIQVKHSNLAICTDPRHDDRTLETVTTLACHLCSFAHACEGRALQAGTPELAYATYVRSCGIEKPTGSGGIDSFLE
uniref:Uncharacterized protein n=1 Tax=Ananas comosus var. bracteatus TaxID=296719 RepID=A0A6V7NT02_ANACO|nr:unnamed protein product [Ananas comosus var. bracteatus]